MLRLTVRCTRVALLAGLIAFAIAGPGTASEPLPSSFTPRTQIAYTPLAIWDRDTVQRLRVQPGSIYTIGTLDPYGRIFDLHQPYEARHATLAPGADRIAFLGAVGSSLPRREDGLYIADTTGRILAFFSGAVDYRWSPDGARLAIRYAMEDAAVTDRTGGIEIWWGQGRQTYKVPVWGDEMGWLSDTRLAVRSGGTVREVALGVDLAHGNVFQAVVRRTSYRFPDLSPDGKYSIQRDAGPWIIETATGRNVTECALAGGAASSPNRPRVDKFGRIASYAWVHQMTRAYWVRLPGAGHLLCATVREDDPYAGLRGRSWRTLICDAETGDVVAMYWGDALGPSADGNGVMRLVSDRIEIGDVFAGTTSYRAVEHPSPAGPPLASLEVEVHEIRRLGNMSEDVRHFGKRFPVRVGDWIPSFLARPGQCDRAFRVDEVPSAGRVMIHYDGRKWLRTRSGGIAIQDDRSEEATGIVMNEGLTLIPRPIQGVDGLSPYEIRIRTVP